MTYLEALDHFADHPHLWRYRELTADDFPGVHTSLRDAWRARIVFLAGGQAADPAPGATPASIPRDVSPDRGSMLIPIPLGRPCGGC